MNKYLFTYKLTSSEDEVYTGVTLAPDASAAMENIMEDYCGDDFSSVTIDYLKGHSPGPCIELSEGIINQIKKELN